MRITGIRLKNFKRFTDLVVRDIPDTAKLVVIVGPNGCGKSSLFDALLQWHRGAAGFGHLNDKDYYTKDKAQDFEWANNVQVSLAGDAQPYKGCLYVRTAYRNDPDFAIGGVSRQNSPAEAVRVGRAIDNDQAVSENYQRLVYDTMSAVYNPQNDAKSVAALRKELIGELRDSMQSVFGDLVLNNISDPLGAGTFFFDKGSAKGYHYKNLSGGEKAAFDLLLDLHVKQKYFKDAIYCIDELETHLHTRVQGVLLKELVKILPDGAQLWVTTHSLGVLRAAQEMSIDKPGVVAVIDFDAADPDLPREIVPSNLGRLSWEKLMSIALDDLSTRVSPKVVVVCEGSSTGNRRKDFDAEIYNRILGANAPDVVFVSGGSSNQVAQNGVSVRNTLSNILPRSKVRALCDRDDKSTAEVTTFESSGDLVLGLRNLESYLLADDVIEALVNREGKGHLLADAMKVKADALTASVARGNPPDDLKSPAGEIYTNLKQLLSLQRCGNNTESFLRDTLSQLVKPPMHSYQLLQASILTRL